MADKKARTSVVSQDDKSQSQSQVSARQNPPPSKGGKISARVDDEDEESGGEKSKRSNIGSSNNNNNADNQGAGDQGQQDAGGKFQQLPLRDYYEGSVTQVLLEGLRELGAKRPENPIQFLGKFLLDHDPERK